MTIAPSRSGIQVMDGSGGEGGLGVLDGAQALLQSVKQAHQLIHFGDDAVLFGQRRDR